ncbi:MAG: hypothetical protein IJ800_01815 [Clostridia bacterium]|nr:hypothetical protein [Clostridia bacterium]
MEFTENEALEDLIRANRLLVNYKNSEDDVKILIDNVRHALKAYDNALALKENARNERKKLNRQRKLDEKIARIYGRAY